MLSERAAPPHHIRRDKVPTTVPHSGRESFEGTAPLFKTTLGATPKIGDVPSDHRTACRRIAARFRRWFTKNEVSLAHSRTGNQVAQPDDPTFDRNAGCVC